VTTPDTIAPTTPTGLTASDVNAVQINLSWTASTDTGGSGLTGYKIYRGGAQIATSATTSYSDTSGSANTAYSYTVAAYDGAGNVSGVSNTASATTNSVPSTPGQPGPRGLVTQSPWTEFWSASAGPVHHYVLKTVDDFFVTQTHTINAPSTSYSLTTGNGGSLTISVQGCNSSNQCSPFSATSDVTYCKGGLCP